jgi:hypothetical protein
VTAYSSFYRALAPRRRRRGATTDGDAENGRGRPPRAWSLPLAAIERAPRALGVDTQSDRYGIAATGRICTALPGFGPGEWQYQLNAPPAAVMLFS